MRTLLPIWWFISRLGFLVTFTSDLDPEMSPRVKHATRNLFIMMWTFSRLPFLTFTLGWDWQTDRQSAAYRNGLLPMQCVFLIRSSASGKKYVTRRSRVTYIVRRMSNVNKLSRARFVVCCIAYFVTSAKEVTWSVMFGNTRERIKNTYCMDKRPFLFLLLIYMWFLTTFFE